MRRRPPRSTRTDTLFPYTTLFRSGFAGMRKAGRLSAEILDALVPFVQPGVTTAEIDDLVRTMMLEGGGIPATLGYRGFTHSCRSEEHTSELQSLMRISYAVFCLKKKKKLHTNNTSYDTTKHI